MTAADDYRVQAARHLEAAQQANTARRIDMATVAALLAIAEELRMARQARTVLPGSIRCAVCDGPVEAGAVFHQRSVGAGHMACVNSEAARRAAGGGEVSSP